jgi:hypothetical protein
VPPTKTKPSSNKKLNATFGLHHAKHKAISLDDDILESFEKPNIIIGEFDVEKPSTKETRVTSTTTVTSRLVGALRGKIKPTLTTSMVSPLETKCLIWELINNVSFIGMIDMKK